MRVLRLSRVTFDSAARVAVQIDEEVVFRLILLLAIVAAFQSQSPFIFDFKVMAHDVLAIGVVAFGAEVEGFVEVAGGSDEDLCDFFDVGGEEVHANV
jgi:hypothetical protein